MQAGELHFRHQELRKLVAEARIATKLSAVLDATGMARDAYVRWEPYWPSGGRVYSPGAALTLSGNVAALLFMALVLGWWLLSQAKPGFQARKWGCWVALLAVVVGVAVYSLGLPKVSGLSLRTVRVSVGGIWNDGFELAVALMDELTDSNVVAKATLPARPLTPDELERLLRSAAHDYQNHWPSHSRKDHPLTNLFTGEAIRFEASPGNVVLRPAVQAASGDTNMIPRTVTNAYELIWHDLDGAEAITNPVPPWLR